jgi:hypothetical protein
MLRSVSESGFHRNLPVYSLIERLARAAVDLDDFNSDDRMPAPSGFYHAS